MVLDEEKLHFFVSRLVKRGVPKKRAKELVFGFVNALNEGFKEGDELPLPGSIHFCFKKVNNRIIVQPREGAATYND